MGTYTKLIEPENLLESVPPKVSSPFVTESCVVGSNEIATKFWLMTACENRLSVTEKQSLMNICHDQPPRFLTSGDNSFGIRTQGPNSETIRTKPENTIHIVKTSLVSSDSDGLSKDSQRRSKRDLVVKLSSFRRLSGAFHISSIGILYHP